MHYGVLINQNSKWMNVGKQSLKIPRGNKKKLVNQKSIDHKNGQMKKDKRTNNNLQSATQKN